MRKFYTPAGTIANSTLTVGELRELLAQLPANMPVFAEWEGVHAYIAGAQDRIINKGIVMVQALILDAGEY